MEKEREHVKLHITLMNVQFIETELNRNRKKNTFDATKILEVVYFHLNRLKHL